MFIKARRAGIIGAVGGAIGAALYWGAPAMASFEFEDLVEVVERWQGKPLAPVIYLLVYTPAAFVLPYGIFPITGGVLFGFWQGFLLSLLAVSVSAWIAFETSRRYGPAIAPARLKRSVRNIEPQIKRYGARALFLIRLSRIIPFFAVNYAAGISGIRIREYMIATVLGVSLWIAGFTYFADTLWELALDTEAKGFREALHENRFHLIFGAIFAAAAVGTIVGVRRWVRNRRRKSARFRES